MKSLTLANPIVSIKSVLPADFAEPIEVNGHVFTANIIRQALKHGRKFFGKCHCGAIPAPLRPQGMYMCDTCRARMSKAHHRKANLPENLSQRERDLVLNQRRRAMYESKYIEPYFVRGLRGF